MYVTVLVLHSWLRWALLIVGLWAVVRAFLGTSGPRPWTPADRTAGLVFTIAMDTQLLIGVVLYGVLSPLTTQAMGSMGEAMRNPQVRFWLVEHTTLMVAAVALVHVGRAKSRQATTDAGRHRAVALFFTLALLAMLLAIPWPFMSVGRPLFRF